MSKFIFNLYESFFMQFLNYACRQLQANEMRSKKVQSRMLRLAGLRIYSFLGFTPHFLTAFCKVVVPIPICSPCFSHSNLS